jgi:hypothetical protein
MVYFLCMYVYMSPLLYLRIGALNVVFHIHGLELIRWRETVDLRREKCLFCYGMLCLCV